MANKKVRMIIEFEINEEICKEYEVDEKDIFDEIEIYPSDIIDGYEIYATHPDLDVASDFVLCNNAYIVSKEFIN